MAQLPEQADVVVIGGGVMGASTAFHLAEAGVSVVLVERSELASGSTSKAAGGVRANFSDELNVAIGARSLNLLADFGTRPGQEIDLHRPGYMFALTQAQDVALFERSTAIHHQFNVRSEMLTPAQAHAKNPLLNVDDVLAASFTPDDGHCTPESVVMGYATGARRHGATVLTNVRQGYAAECPNVGKLLTNLKFDLDKLVVKAGTEVTLTITNKDSGVPHNLTILEGSTKVFEGEQFVGIATEEYTLPALDAAKSYTFRCDVHPNMKGTIELVP